MGEDSNPEVKDFFEKGMANGAAKRSKVNKATKEEAKGELLSNSNDFELDIDELSPPIPGTLNQNDFVTETDKRKFVNN